MALASLCKNLLEIVYINNSLMHRIPSHFVVQNIISRYYLCITCNFPSLMLYMNQNKTNARRITKTKRLLVQKILVWLFYREDREDQGRLAQPENISIQLSPVLMP